MTTSFLMTQLFYWFDFSDITFFWFLPTIMALSSFLHMSTVFSQSLYTNTPQDSCKHSAFTLHTLPGRSPPFPLFQSFSICIFLPYSYLQPRIAFLNYKSTCLHACWSSLLGDLTDTTNLTCTNLNSTFFPTLFLSQKIACYSASSPRQKLGNHH